MPGPGFNDLITQYRGMSEGYPDTILDDLSGAFSEHDGIASAKVQQLTVENARLQQELDSAKAANYDYYMASQQAAPEGGGTQEESPSGNEGQKEKPSDLFSEEDR